MSFETVRSDVVECSNAMIPEIDCRACRFCDVAEKEGAGLDVGQLGNPSDGRQRKT